MLLFLSFLFFFIQALAAGADQSYIFEEQFTINDLVDDIRHLRNKIEGDLKRGLLIRNEMANKNYTSEFIRALMSEEGKGVFSARCNIPGHMQQGGATSPFDRNLGIKFGARSLNFIVDLLENNESLLSGKFLFSNYLFVKFFF
jgi:6-phosphofructokinase 1